jgi:pyruvate formate-lyase activating enzyme-like uncharacterized protein
MSNDQEISEGCQLCQQGKWFCIFLTYKCSATCHFCPAPLKNDTIQTAFGNRKEDILPFLLNNDFKGISFSGGDPFIVFERLLEWLVFFKKHIPDCYYWVYTNGLDVNELKLKKLASAGMNEVRFNIAATGYNTHQIWKKIEQARNIFPFVAVEIPSISADYEQLVMAIDKMEQHKIDYLNLHDYIVSDSDFNEKKEPLETFTLNKILKLKYTKSSCLNTYNIIKYIDRKGYNIKVNHCSMQQKEIQMLNRRLKFGKIFINPEYDLMLDDGITCNYFSIPQPEFSNISTKDIFRFISNSLLDKYLIKVNKVNSMKPENFIRLEARFIPKIEINEKKILLDFKILR